MHPITNYIKERIKELKETKKTNKDYASVITMLIEELQAVLSKLEEL